MKDGEKNEIEVLLRNLAKGKRSALVTPGNGQDVEANHLDADEMSSFAEGRLPSPTRALYAAHLADCDRCRSLVAQLATASGIGSVRTEAAAKQKPWTFFATFLSPRVMRYTIPALA